jgi:hypothetical protein
VGQVERARQKADDSAAPAFSAPPVPVLRGIASKNIGVTADAAPPPLPADVSKVQPLGSTLRAPLTRGAEEAFWLVSRPRQANAAIILRE